MDSVLTLFFFYSAWESAAVKQLDDVQNDLRYCIYVEFHQVQYVDLGNVSETEILGLC